MPPGKTLWVLAGTYQQYRWFCSQHGLNPHEVRYLGQPYHLLGLEEVTILLVGTWETRGDIYDEAKSREKHSKLTIRDGDIYMAEQEQER